MAEERKRKRRKRKCPLFFQLLHTIEALEKKSPFPLPVQSIHHIQYHNDICGKLSQVISLSICLCDKMFKKKPDEQLFVIYTYEYLESVKAFVYCMRGMNPTGTFTILEPQKIVEF